MLYIIIIALFLAVGIIAFISANRESNINNITQRASSTNKYDNYYVGQKVIGLSTRKGYKKYSLAGGYYRNLSIDMVGKFNGYAIAQTDNEHDPYAIAVYDDAGTHLGFLPRGNKVLYRYIINEEGKVHAYGYLGWNNGIYGEVCVETNKELVTKRNKPYNTNLVIK